MRQVCRTSARCLRPVVSSTSVLTRNTHQAKAQAPSTTGSPSSGDYDLKLVNGKKTFSLHITIGTFFYVVVSLLYERAPFVWFPMCYMKGIDTKVFVGGFFFTTRKYIAC